MEKGNKIVWEEVKVSDKKEAGIPVSYIIDEICCYDFGLNKNKNNKL
ncbi:MAG: hypothetical protein ACJAVA_000351 [Flavobacteriaceae bacterium]|jgi:hypothetical protein